MSNLQILSKSIRTFGNLHCLNDCHQASGNLQKHKPVLFLRLDSTKELIEEIQKEDPTTQPLKTLRGTQGGTYACEELVLAYAMWISPKFHLVVLRAFLAMHKGELQNSAQIVPLAEIEADEEALHIIVNLFHSLNGAYEMGEKIRREHQYLAKEIDKTIGGHYLYNLNGPTENALTKARKYVHAKSERIMFVKGMLSLLEEPKQTARF
ncbi:KilA-N domain-containing protein [Glaesserella parasuis]|uniref:KilA-N domain-containing protein n=1 Tax=Glaesserella parasuis TaxID=738 RepID=UPI0003AC01FC|nr:KilA-N domain-containing protein [Glaesserella parasuis]EQA13934.1 kilA-N domain protein [Glaesserella parasuis SW140]MCT8761553.1 KilA-N domain-containing protein [Glaesserella parasuis]MCT8767525.1 KilA-N domain-containing protein [Glaesserella parasuis]MDG6236293.1 KilA-N domain-containing protein [Glaesserella parasuis]MDO9673891.1 KilA-N domain-containing protein [Glaesserella parasuis]